MAAIGLTRLIMEIGGKGQNFFKTRYTLSENFTDLVICFLTNGLR